MSYAKLNKVVIFNTISTQNLFEIAANLDRQWLFFNFYYSQCEFSKFTVAMKRAAKFSPFSQFLLLF